MAEQISRIVSWFVLSSLLTGCYTLQPVRTLPPVGSRVALDVNDAGRVALGGSIGPAIERIEGSLVAENGDYVIAVSSIRFIGGGAQIWTGERVAIKPDHVNMAFERRFSRGRTITLVTTLVAATAAVAFGSDLVGLGREDRPRPPRDPDPTELIGRRP